MITEQDFFFDATKVLKLHSLLQFCAKNREPITGKVCHGQVIRLGLETDTLTSNMLMTMYSKCGLIRHACKVFDEMPERSMVSWNIMIGTCVQNGEEEKAIGDVFFCMQLHALAVKAVVDADVFVGTALLDVYAKCGSIEEAICVFEGMPERSDVTWSSLVAGFVQNELHEEGLVLFARGKEMGLENNQFMISSVIRACAGLAALIEGRQTCLLFGSDEFVRREMQHAGVQPDEVTYVALLSACVHGGLVDKGRSYFDLMTREHHVSPNVLHYSCMVDLLGIHGELELAEIAAKNLFEMEPDRGGNYVLLANTYAAGKKWEEAAKARKSLERGVRS
ncbi:hypothetical protein OIU84_020143 [Salix udensis]|uniref:Pentatricopeptide repeat-containing protein n=1 Tax=Salix udensis TaxID=889485 RepID=A0AAD6L2B6_9ROSI|nr:hypothetical protein OIU84_020143 [Salix udensis]